MKRPRLIVIVGPTSSGKSALAVYLAKYVGGEVVSADSRQVYKGLNLATGKISKKEMNGIAHYMIDILSPKKTFSASDFIAQGRSAITQVLSKRKIPIVVGGTGLYIDSLLGRISLPEVAPNMPLRSRLEKQSVEELFSLLKKKDVGRARTIEPHHKRRLIRAIEIAYALGKNPKPKSTSLYEVLWLGIKPSDRILRTNIHNRLIARLKKGMVAEAKVAHLRGLSYKRMEELGLEVRSLARLLRGDVSKKTFIEEVERASIKYARRQMRWFSRNKEIIWITNRESAAKLVKKFITPS